MKHNFGLGKKVSEDKTYSLVYSFVQDFLKEQNKGRREQYLKQYGNLCNSCGEYHERLEFHHKLRDGDKSNASKLYAYIEKDPDNIILLCPKCHKKAHRDLDNSIKNDYVS